MNRKLTAIALVTAAVLGFDEDLHRCREQVPDLVAESHARRLVHDDP